MKRHGTFADVDSLTKDLGCRLSVEDYRDDDGTAEIASALAHNESVGNLEGVTDGLRGEGL
jgi:hypothetical protein